MAPRLRRFLLPLGLVGAVLLAPRGTLPVGGQTIPLRPTSTPEVGSFSVGAQPTPPPVPTVPAVQAVPTGPASVPTRRPETPVPAATATRTVVPLPSATVQPTVTAQPARGLRAAHVDGAALPAPPAGWRRSETAMQLTGALAPGAAAEQLAVTFSTRDLAAAGGAPSGLALFFLDESGAWVREPTQSPDGASGRITFRPTRPGVYAVMAAGIYPEQGDYAIPSGRFFRVATAQGGEASPLGGPGGYSVVDGAGGAPAAFWSVYTAIGGEAVLGRPVSRRFLQDGRLVQAFERGVIAADARSNATARPGVSVEVPGAAREPEPPPPSTGG